jgi:hypothetical protein
MPSGVNDQTVYLSTGDPETFYNQTSLYKPGELGKKFTHTTGKRYQIVQVDSSVSATYTATVVNGLVYWATRASYTVVPTETDALNLALINGVAGRSPGITTKGNYFAMQIGGTAVLVYGGTTTAGVVGSAVIGKATTLSDANAVTYASGITNKVVGWVTVAGTATQITASLCLDDVEVG